MAAEGMGGMRRRRRPMTDYDASIPRWKGGGSLNRQQGTPERRRRNREVLAIGHKYDKFGSAKEAHEEKEVRLDEMDKTENYNSIFAKEKQKNPLKN
ncbi:hypothetical protein CEXT_435051 [Caerostris extrusa]|uniref:Uncharacterized protein n=1 Tax=Caerostris extrusa TaxID=172846 RepID=A0AAV4RME9_CAEEX|nr:hypothetical protein CEXT_435051 [Caerostris extrusa]